MTPLTDLADQWRAEAETLRQYGADRLVTACEEHADQLEAAIQKYQAKALTVGEAAQESGYSTDHLRRLVRDGEIPNAGEDGAPRICRADLPRKPGHRTNGSEPEAPVGSRTQVARSVVESD